MKRMGRVAVGAMKRLATMVTLAMAAGMVSPGFAGAQAPPLLPASEVAALAQELSGEVAKRNLEGIARFHRQRGSQGFHSAAELVAERARAYGLSDVTILQFPADGKIFYGTQRSRPAWDAEFAELWELKSTINGKNPELKPTVDGKNQDTVWNPAVRIGSYEAEPVILAEDSESADTTADLVDVGEGTKESDYAGKDVKGKLVLAGAQPGAVQDLAVGQFGAAGIVSYAQNQKTAWWGEDENLIRWGHLETFSAHPAFGFMVSLKTARGLQERLAKGEEIRLHAMVRAGQHAGNYEVVTATIPGSDPKFRDDEIAFSCHLDHQRPGANDNASGCATILEVARTLQRLIGEGKLARPARTIRFIWPPEIEGTLALLNGKPEFAQRIKAVVHMDMVGGGPVTKAVFHVTRGPMSLPSFVHDVAWAFGEFVNEQSYQFAAEGHADYPLVAPEGGKEALLAQDTAYTMGSDHDVYQDSSFRIPAIYLNDWPDRYIHTNFDSAANIDPTKLKRAAFIGAASGYYLAGLGEKDLSALREVMKAGDDARIASNESRSRQLPAEDAACAAYYVTQANLQADAKLKEFMHANAKETGNMAQGVACALDLARSRIGDVGFSRKAEPRGPLAVFGYDFYSDHAPTQPTTEPRLLRHQGTWGGGEEYAYEVLNFANGVLDSQQIRDRVSVEYGPIPLEFVSEYLLALEKAGLVTRFAHSDDYFLRPNGLVDEKPKSVQRR
jgi:aminopeptidase YwaD